jgi:hypothetical protein
MNKTMNELLPRSISAHFFAAAERRRFGPGFTCFFSPIHYNLVCLSSENNFDWTYFSLDDKFMAKLMCRIEAPIRERL